MADVQSLFVTGTNTDVGKTFVTRGLARAFLRQPKKVVALKPVETGYVRSTSDALALARAAGCAEEVVGDSAWYRGDRPLSPFAIELRGEKKPVTLSPIITRVREYRSQAEVLLVEGAGGVMVPLNANETFLDFAEQLNFSTILVASNALGVQSNVLTSLASLRSKGIRVVAIVLSNIQQKEGDESLTTNAKVIAHFAKTPVVEFPKTENDDEKLAESVERSGLLAALRS